MRFRLIYTGRLPAETRTGSKGRTREKMEARRQFHRQLKELLHQDEFLKSHFHTPGAKGRTRVQVRAENFSRCGYRFVPIITEHDGEACSLDILFLRRDGPGSLVKSGGDIDNRIKVLFDGLRLPQECSEVPDGPDADEDPFFCLLQDDRLISEVKVTTDRLITPQKPGEGVNDVLLIITVTPMIIDPRRKPAYYPGPLR